ncbi:hypothetical protein ASD44_00475 [Mesorhizobium sp. Root554]|nr:hypothetical protein ASD27_00475 [Mesorhizobium sp. Root1471]KQZ35219.1 hypothetical protein ASD44_00475 [Mesorhizobium sp. Root554]
MVNQRMGSASAEEDSRMSSEVSSFARGVLEALDRVEYRLCDRGDDLEAIYRLRYNSYVHAGMVKPDASRMVHDKFDDLPNSFRFGVFVDGSLASTIRIHFASRKNPISPSTDVFPDILGDRVANGETFVDPSRFAADAEWSGSLRALPYITLRLAVVACNHFDATSCLTAIKEEHASFYHRIFRSSMIAPPRTYPGLTVPVHLYESRCSENMQVTLDRFPFFNSTRFEQRLMFGRASIGELAPLTILPTAKYYRDAA